MEQGPEAVLVIHVGGAYGDIASGIDRWCQMWDKLPEAIRRRLVLEHDDLRYSAADVLAIHARTGVRLVFDVQHFWCLNREGLELKPTLERFLQTWPVAIQPKIHFSSPHTEMREVKRKSRETGRMKRVLLPPVWTGHADFVHPFDFINFCRPIAGLNADIMLEAKAKDLALLRLQRDLLSYGPDVAEQFGLRPKQLPESVEEVLIDPEELQDA